MLAGQEGQEALTASPQRVALPVPGFTPATIAPALKSREAQVSQRGTCRRLCAHKHSSQHVMGTTVILREAISAFLPVYTGDTHLSGLHRGLTPNVQLMENVCMCASTNLSV